MATKLTVEQLNEQAKRNSNMVRDGLGAVAVAEHTDPEYLKKAQTPVRDTEHPRSPDTALNEDQHELLVDVKALFDEAEAAGGVAPATALQMHPWKVPATGPHNAGIELPACPVQDEYIPFTLRTFRRDFGDRGGKFKVTAIWPITILRDFQRQHENWGGIVVYMGDKLPGQAKSKVENFYDKLWSVLKKITDKEVKEMLQQTIEEGRADQSRILDKAITDSELKKLIVQAKDKQILYYESMYQTAEQIFSDPKANHRIIQYPHRQIAKWLHARGRYSVLPKWVSETKPRDFVEKPCPKCGAAVDLDKQGNYRGYCCMKCNKILDPIRAFQAFPPEPGAKELLRYCSRESLDAAGLQHILTVAEEDAAEAKEAKKAEKEKGTK